MLEKWNNFKNTRKGEIAVKVGLICSVFIGFFLFISLFPIQISAPSENWWNSSFIRRANITIVNETTDSFSFVLRANITIDDNMQLDVDDLRFINVSCGEAGGSLLKYEVENYTSDYAIAHIKLENFQGENKTICMYYGYADAENNESSSEVFSDDYLMAMHLHETSGVHADSTSYGNAGTIQLGVVQDATGILDGADDFDGSDDRIDFPDRTYWDFGTGNFTFGNWYKIDTAISDVANDGRRLFGFGQTGVAPNQAYAVGYGTHSAWQGLGNDCYNFFTYDGSYHDHNSDTIVGGINTGVWYYFVVTRRGNTVYFYHNGTEVGTSDITGESLNASNYQSLGCRQGNAGRAEFHAGILDEMIIINASRSEGWVKQNFKIVSDPDNYVIFGEEESSGDGTSPTWSNNTTSTTPAGQPCTFTADANDNLVLQPAGQYIFETNNTGTFHNSTAFNFTSTPESMTNTTMLNSTIGTLIQWRYYFDDNAGNWNKTDALYLTTTEAEAGGWWNNNWNRRKNVTLKNISTSTFENFTYFVNVTIEDEMESDLSDLRFILDGSELDFEIENYTTTSAEVWFMLSSFSNEVEVSMYYDNSGASDGQDKHNTWDDELVLVQHFNEYSGSTAYDSSQSKNNGTLTGNPIWITGKIDGGLDFDGNDYVTHIDNNDWDLGDGSFTIESWFKSDVAISDADNDVRNMMCAGLTGNSYFFSYGAHSSWQGVGKDCLNFNRHDGSYHDFVSDEIAGGINPGTWYYAVLVRSGNTLYFYLDGVGVGSTAYTYATNSNNVLKIGTKWVSPSETHKGILDEVRLTKGEDKSADWVNQSYLMVAEQNTYTIWGSEESRAYTNGVELNSPIDNELKTQLNVNFTYTPTFYHGVIYNCSLYTNESGWSLKESNTSEINNNSLNWINVTFGNYGIYLCNIGCFNFTHEIFPASNITINVSSVPYTPIVTITKPTNITYYNGSANYILQTEFSASNNISTYEIRAYVDDVLKYENTNYANGTVIETNITIQDTGGGQVFKVNITDSEGKSGENSTTFSYLYRFSVVYLPDTQNYVISVPHIFDNQTEWIALNKDSHDIVFVAHLGDIVDAAKNITNWNFANTSMWKLDNANIKHMSVPGNHDIELNDSSGNNVEYDGDCSWCWLDTTGKNTTNYNTYFGRQTSFDWVKGNKGIYGGDEAENVVAEFTVGDYRFKIIGLQYCPTAAIIDWANETFNNTANTYNLIAFTHSGLHPGSGGSRTGCGNAIWDRFVNFHNITVFESGHRPGEGYHSTTNIHGYTVFERLADYQSRANGGDGWLEIVEYQPVRQKMNFTLYSPYKNEVEDDGDSGFLLDWTPVVYSPAVDETSPTYSLNSTNSTLAGTIIEFSIKWTDETGLATIGGYIFSIDNGTSSFINDSWSAFSSNPDWSNVTKITNSTIGTTIQWIVYANDTSNNWNTSETYSFETTYSVDSTKPTYSNNITHPSSPATYSPNQDYQFNATWTDNIDISDVVLEFDGTNYTYLGSDLTKSGNIYYITFSDLGVANYNYKWYANDTSDNWNNTDQVTYEINKGATDITLLLNGTHGNRNYNTNQIANFTTYLNISGKTVYLDSNITGWVEQSGTTPLYNTTNLTTVGTYNITGYWSGDANYTGDSETFYAMVSELELTSPLWRNQGQSSDSIDSGDSNILSAQGYDETPLDWAWLSTNEAGVWKNFTKVSFFDKYPTTVPVDWASAQSLPNYYIDMVNGWQGIHHQSDGNYPKYSTSPTENGWIHLDTPHYPTPTVANISKIYRSAGNVSLYINKSSGGQSVTTLIFLKGTEIDRFTVSPGVVILKNYTIYANNLTDGQVTFTIQQHSIIYHAIGTGAGYYEASISSPCPPVDMEDASATWLWSNFTWQNISVLENIVGWKIYYNDTSGNENVTDVMTFNISHYLITSTEYEDYVNETETYNFSIVFEANFLNVENITSYLIYNGTNKGIETYHYKNSTHIVNTKEMAIPLFQNNASTPDFYFYNVVDYVGDWQTTINSTTNNQTVLFLYYFPTDALTVASSDQLLEGESFSTTLNLTSLSENADITANITCQDANHSMTADDYNNFSATIDSGYITSGLNETFNITGTVGLSFDGSERYMTAETENTTVYKLLITDCSGGSGSTTKVLTFNLKNEENTTEDIIGTLDISMDVWKIPDTKRNYSFGFSGDSTYDICIYPAWAVMYTDAMLEYDSENTTKREYYLSNATISNSTSEIDLYLLEYAKSTQVIFSVKDETGTLAEGSIVKIQRYYTDTNTYLTVAMVKTDEDGKSATYLYVDEAFYKFIVEYENEIKTTTSPGKIIDADGDGIYSKELTWAGGLGELYDYIGKVGYLCNYNNDTRILRCSVSDTSGKMQETCIKIIEIGVAGTEEIYENCQESTATDLVYEFDNTTGKTYQYGLFIRFTTGAVYHLMTGIIETLSTPLYGSMGLLISFMILMVMAFAGTWNPTVSILLGITALIFSAIMGLFVVSTVSLVGIALVGVVLIYKMKA